jgi:hypothetical protein
METSLSEYIGMAIVAIAILIMTAQTAYAYGFRVGGNSERLLANRRVNGILDYENRRPKSAKNKRRATRKRVAGELVGGVL